VPKVHSSLLPGCSIGLRPVATKGSATFEKSSATFGESSATFGKCSATFGKSSATFGKSSATFGKCFATFWILFGKVPHFWETFCRFWEKCCHFWEKFCQFRKKFLTDFCISSITYPVLLMQIWPNSANLLPSIFPATSYFSSATFELLAEISATWQQCYSFYND
jgi:hypothetical protein